MADDGAGTSRSRASGTAAPWAARPRPSRAISFGPYLLCANLRLLEKDGVAVELGDRAFEILCVLTEHAGEIVSSPEGLLSQFRFVCERVLEALQAGTVQPGSHRE